MLTSHHESQVRLPDDARGILVEFAPRSHPTQPLVVEGALAIPEAELAGLGDAPITSLVAVVQQDARTEEPVGAGRSFVVAPFAERVVLAGDLVVSHGVVRAGFRIAIDEILAAAGATLPPLGASVHHRVFVSLGPRVSNAIEATRSR